MRCGEKPHTSHTHARPEAQETCVSSSRGALLTLLKGRGGATTSEHTLRLAQLPLSLQTTRGTGTLTTPSCRRGGGPRGVVEQTSMDPSCWVRVACGATPMHQASREREGGGRLRESRPAPAYHRTCSCGGAALRGPRKESAPLPPPLPERPTGRRRQGCPASRSPRASPRAVGPWDKGAGIFWHWHWSDDPPGGPPLGRMPRQRLRSVRTLQRPVLWLALLLLATFLGQATAFRIPGLSPSRSKVRKRGQGTAFGFVVVVLLPRRYRQWLSVFY